MMGVKKCTGKQRNWKEMIHMDYAFSFYIMILFISCLFSLVCNYM